MLKKILRKQGDTVAIGEALAEIDDTVKSAGADGRDEKSQGGKAQEGTSARDGKARRGGPHAGFERIASGRSGGGGAVAAAPVPAAAASAVASAALESPVRAPPSARKMMLEAGLSADDVRAAGGRIQTQDVVRTLDQRKGGGGPATAVSARADVREEPDERVVPMTQLRKTIARRLVEAKNTAAMLTTFNEIDMSNVLALREKYQDRFTKQHGIKLGFMSFFAKAAIEGLRAFPAVNAEIRGTDIIYKDHYDIGVAVGGGKGLVVPVIRGADRMSFADLEKTIVGLGARAKDNKLQMSDLEGGTFTISNGGIYGSLMSTPILNPPQSGILGLHAIQKRAVVIDDAIVVRPMMYVALSYDHRIVDGREAVQFLVKVKECVETPSGSCSRCDGGGRRRAEEYGHPRGGMMTGVAIRRATESDVPGLLRLYAQLDAQGGQVLSVDAGVAIMRRMATYPDYGVYVATSPDGAVVGTFALLAMETVAHRGAPSAIVEDVCVDERLRRRGVGGAMMAFAMQHARERGCYKLALSSNLGRAEAHAFYRSLGFEQHGLSFRIGIVREAT